MGKHVNVQAFKEQIDHRHSMNVEDARRIITNLAQRHAVGAVQ